MKIDKLKQQASKIKVIATDVDGVLTDGFIFINSKMGEPFGKFSIYDGFGIEMAHKAGLKIIVISGRKSLCTEARCKKLGIDEVYTGVRNKKAHLIELANQLNLNFDEMAYIGDDIIDLGAMSLVGLRVSPANGVKDVQDYVHYITKARGGDGALRELIELILKAQKKYKDVINSYIM